MSKKKVASNPIIVNILYTLFFVLGLRALKIALITLVSITLIFHVLIITFFNLDFTKQWLLEKINSNYLSPMGLEFSFESLNVSMWSTRINLNGAALHVLPRRVKGQQASPKTTPIFIHNVSVGFSPVRFWTSGEIYMSALDISGLNLDIISQIELDHIGALFNLGEEEAIENPEATDYSELVFSLSPNSFNIHKSNIRFSLPNELFHFKTKLELFSFKKKNALSQSFFTVVLQTRDNVLLHPSLDAPADLSQLIFVGDLSKEGEGGLEKLSLVFDKSRIDTSGKFTLTPEFTALKSYELISSADLIFYELLNIVDIDAEGKGTLDVSITPESKDNMEPYITGDFNWSGFFMENFELYDGKADVTYSKRNLKIKDARVDLPQKGSYVVANGDFKMGGEYPYSVSADFHDIPFERFLQGLTVDSSPANFTMNTTNGKFSGLILPKKSRNLDRFSLNVSAAITATGLKAPDIADGVILEKCFMNLKLFSDASYQGHQCCLSCLQMLTTLQLPNKASWWVLEDSGTTPTQLEISSVLTALSKIIAWEWILALMM